MRQENTNIPEEKELTKLQIEGAHRLLSKGGELTRPERNAISKLIDKLWIQIDIDEAKLTNEKKGH